MNSGAEVVSTKLFHAAGYNVPENFLVEFDPEILKIGDGVTLNGKGGTKRRMTSADLREQLERVQHRPNGKIRVIASKYLPGKLLGPFPLTRELVMMIQMILFHMIFAVN